jgi:hypothetical protein
MSPSWKYHFIKRSKHFFSAFKHLEVSIVFPASYLRAQE